MPKVFIVMGQGAAGDLNHMSFCTATLYSCSGIGMINTATGKGGLFHYPCNALRYQEEDAYLPTVNSLKQMLGFINPTHIGIVTALDDGMGMGTPREDVQAIQTWFGGLGLGFQAQVAGSGVWAGVSRNGFSDTTRHRNWRDHRDPTDFQNRAAGVYNTGRSNVTIVGANGEADHVNVVG